MKNQRALPWMTFPANSSSAFSPETVRKLASRHEFAEDSILALGMDLLVAMSWKVQRLDERQLKVQRKTGEKRRERARKQIEEAERALSAAHAEMSGLAAEDAEALGAFDRNPSNWVARLERVAADLGRLRRDLEYSARLEHALADPTAGDKRLNRDDVRINVLNVVFLFWKEQGRPLSVTTRPDLTHDNVTGPLVDFARDVVAALTVASNILSADTLKSDLRKARNHLEEFDAALPLFPPKTM